MSVDDARALTVDARVEDWREAALPLVVRWEWYSFAFHSLAFAPLQLDGIRPGKRTTTPREPNPKQAHGYGFDMLGRLVVAYQHASGGRFEHHRRHGIDVVSTVCFHHTVGQPWVHASWLSLRERRMDFVYAAGAWHTHLFTLDGDGRVVRRETRATDTHGEETHELRDVAYDAKGKLARVYRRTPTGKRTPVWPRR